MERSKRCHLVGEGRKKKDGSFHRVSRKVCKLDENGRSLGFILAIADVRQKGLEFLYAKWVSGLAVFLDLDIEIL